MCRDIIEAHHGRIRVDSTVGKGTAFTLKLPTVTKAAASKAAVNAPIFPSLAVPAALPLPLGD
jgi:chemotaxis protein histidine kinase CheA